MRRFVLVILLLTLWLTGVHPLDADEGVIRGVVLNGSRSGSVMPDIPVVLRARIHGEFIAVAQQVADNHGEFRFDDLPVDAQIEYLPGANHAEVHYPGPRVRLAPESLDADVTIVAYEASREPNPLVVRQHEVEIRDAGSVLEIYESMTIENPSNYCFVGKSASASGRIATLTLSIPPDFQKVTFTDEFFGRRFSLSEGILATGVPWPPGVRQLSFSYAVARDEGPLDWQRPLDLPCDAMQLAVHTELPQAVRCNLTQVAARASNCVRFVSADKPLAAGSQIDLALSVPRAEIMTYGRWLAAATLLAFMGGTILFLRQTNRMD